MPQYGQKEKTMLNKMIGSNSIRTAIKLVLYVCILLLFCMLTSACKMPGKSSSSSQNKNETVIIDSNTHAADDFCTPSPSYDMNESMKNSAVNKNFTGDNVNIYITSAVLDEKQEYLIIQAYTSTSYITYSQEEYVNIVNAGYVDLSFVTQSGINNERHFVLDAGVGQNGVTVNSDPEAEPWYDSEGNENYSYWRDGFKLYPIHDDSGDYYQLQYYSHGPRPVCLAYEMVEVTIPATQIVYMEDFTGESCEDNPETVIQHYQKHLKLGNNDCDTFFDNYSYPRISANNGAVTHLS